MKRSMETSPKPALMTPAQATQLLDHIVHERVRDVIDFCGLLHFEQELWRALLDCGVPREDVPRISAEMLARGLTKIGEEHVQLADEREVTSDQHDVPKHMDSAS